MRLLHLPSTTSTMDIAASLVENGDTQTQAVLADKQTKGRGRRGRAWQTFAAPHSLAVTYIEHPHPGPHLALVAALALHDAVLQSFPTLPAENLAIKWPNDLLLSGRKLAGILCETVAQPSAALIGIGLNLTPPAKVPESFTGAFISQALPARYVTVPPPQTLAGAIHTCLSAQLTLYKAQGWGALHNNYLRRCSSIGQKVRWITEQKQKLTGIARGLTEDGHLELESDDGTTHLIHSGEIVESHHESPLHKSKR